MMRSASSEWVARMTWSNNSVWPVEISSWTWILWFGALEEGELGEGFGEEEGGRVETDLMGVERWSWDGGSVESIWST